jgi:hypothetical protein
MFVTGSVEAELTVHVRFIVILKAWLSLTVLLIGVCRVASRCDQTGEDREELGRLPSFEHGLRSGHSAGGSAPSLRARWKGRGGVFPGCPRTPYLRVAGGFRRDRLRAHLLAEQGARRRSRGRPARLALLERLGGETGARVKRARRRGRATCRSRRSFRTRPEPDVERESASSCIRAVRREPCRAGSPSTRWSR